MMDSTFVDAMAPAPDSLADTIIARYGLRGKRGLVLGIANEDSIAYHCAMAARELGARMVVTVERAKSLPYVEPCARALDAVDLVTCDVTNEADLTKVFESVVRNFGGLDFVLHSVAFAPLADLHGLVTDCSLEGFLQGINISCHSFTRIAKRAEMLMEHGGSLVTMTYEGATRVKDPSYSMMGPIKAALESTVRYIAHELGPKSITVNAVSPGPMPTRAGKGLKNFNRMMADCSDRAPLMRLASKASVAAEFVHLIGNGGRDITGQVRFVDAGYSIV